MRYSFFIQKTRGPNGKFVDTFIMLPTVSRENELQQTRMQQLITENRLHTYVNIPVDGTVLKFKGSHTQLGKQIHPVLIIMSSRDGAFRLPFEAGEGGLEVLKETYRGIQMAFQRLYASRYQRLQRDEAQRRLLAAEAESEKGNGTDGSVAPKQKAPPRRSSHGEKVIYLGEHPSTMAPQSTTAPEPMIKTSVAAAEVEKGAATKTSSQGQFVKWLVIGSSLSLMLMCILYMARAHAAEPMTTPARGAATTKTSAPKDSFAGFPVPQIQNDSLVVAKKASHCTLTGLGEDSSIALAGIQPLANGKPE